MLAPENYYFLHQKVFCLFTACKNVAWCTFKQMAYKLMYTTHPTQVTQQIVKFLRLNLTATVFNLSLYTNYTTIKHFINDSSFTVWCIMYVHITLHHHKVNSHFVQSSRGCSSKLVSYVIINLSQLSAHVINVARNMCSPDETFQHFKCTFIFISP